MKNLNELPKMYQDLAESPHWTTQEVSLLASYIEPLSLNVAEAIVCPFVGITWLAIPQRCKPDSIALAILKDNEPALSIKVHGIDLEDVPASARQSLSAALAWAVSAGIPA